MLTASLVGCHRCPLSCTRKTIVDGTGLLTAPLMVVGEFPGPQEDRAGSPFVGPAGKLLKATITERLHALRLDHAAVRYTSAVRCFAGKYLDEKGVERFHRPDQAAQDACLPWLVMELEEVRPRVVLAAGSIAQTQVANAVFELDGVLPRVVEIASPGWVIRNRKELEQWQDRIEQALRLAYGLPEMVTTRVEAEPWSLTTLDQIGFGSRYLGADTETDDLEEGIGVKRVGWSVSDGERSTFTTQAVSSQLPHVYLHNAKYDIPLLGIDAEDLSAWDDTMLMAYCTRWFERIGLKEVGPKLTGVQWRETLTTLMKRRVSEEKPIGTVLPPSEKNHWRAQLYLPCNHPTIQCDGSCSRGDGTHPRSKAATRLGLPDTEEGARQALALMKQQFGVPETRTVWKVEKCSFSQALAARPDDCTLYAATDALITSRIARWLDQHMEPWARDYYERIEKPLLPVLLKMEQTGVMIDPDKMRAAGEVIDQAAVEAEAELRSALGGVNLASTRELGPELLRREIVDGKRTDSDGIGVAKQNILAAFGAETEEQLPDTEEGRIAKRLLEWRAMKKLRSTYVDALLRRLDGQSRVHGRYNQASTNTNRLSSSDPNLQNIPARTALGLEIRKAFVAPPGSVLVVGDYSQLQLRVYGEYTQERLFLEAYCAPWDCKHLWQEEGRDLRCVRCGFLEKDIHGFLADEMNIARKIMKNVTFGVLFGGEAEKLAQVGGVPQEKIVPFLDRMRERIPSLLTWKQRIGQELAAQGYVESLQGWRMYYPDYFLPVQKWHLKALREAANGPIQATEAGTVKRMMVAMYHALKHHYPQARMVLQVHDEVGVECPEVDASGVKELMEEVAADAGKRDLKTVPLRFETKIVTAWGLAK